MLRKATAGRLKTLPERRQRPHRPEDTSRELLIFGNCAAYLPSHLAFVRISAGAETFVKSPATSFATTSQDGQFPYYTVGLTR